MKHRVEIGLIFFLLLFFLSLGDPLVYVGAIVRRIPKLERPAQAECIRQVVPETAHLWAFSNPDLTLNWNTTNFQLTRGQYNLVPRVVEYRLSGPVRVDGFNYFLAFGMGPAAVEPIASQNGLRVLQTCGSDVVLGRN